MNEPKPSSLKNAHSAQLPHINKTLKARAAVKSSLTPTSPDMDGHEQKYDNIDIPSPTPMSNENKITHEPESPSIDLDGPYISKDDLDLHARIAASSQSMNHPRASAVNPISIPLHASQRHITLDTNFDSNLYSKNRKNRSGSQPNTDAISANIPQS